MLKAAELEKFSNATLGLYSPGLEVDGFARRAFGFLEGLASADFLIVATMTKGSTDMHLEFSHPHPEHEAAALAFGQFMDQYDLTNFNPAVNGGKPFQRSDFFSERQFRELDIFQEGFRPLGIMNHCAIHVPSDDNKIVFIGIERGYGPEFSEEERTLFTMAQQHLSNARKLVQTRNSIERNLDVAAFVQAGLTPREAEVLKGICDGLSNADIARSLRISGYTVKDHCAVIFRKLDVESRLNAALRGFELHKRFFKQKSRARQKVVIPVRRLEKSHT